MCIEIIIPHIFFKLNTLCIINKVNVKILLNSVLTNIGMISEKEKNSKENKVKWCIKIKLYEVIIKSWIFKFLMSIISADSVA